MILKRKKFVIQWRKFGLKRSCIFKVMNFWSLCLFLIFIWFLNWFLYQFPLFKIAKKEGSYLQVLKWRARAAGADVARGTTSKVWRGTEATWQSPGGPRGAQVVHKARTRGRWPRSPRKSRGSPWGAPCGRQGLAVGGPKGIVGPWYERGGGNAINRWLRPLFKRVLSHHFLRVGLCPTRYLLFAGDVDGRQLLDSIRTTEIAWTRVHAIIN